MRLAYIGKIDLGDIKIADDLRLWNILDGGDPSTHPNGSTVTLQTLKEMGAL